MKKISDNKFNSQRGRIGHIFWKWDADLSCLPLKLHFAGSASVLSDTDK